ncbi:MAG: diaminopimelate epimerase [Dysgonamonadaceae bacterium]|jgi:diaminopimelate epimerase|nr:diaminopimelate epimerase [Dysgonamonadaceae bacterium]
MKFTKMQGAGNDYIYFNLFEEPVENPEAVSVVLSDRHFGVGGDGIVLIGKSDVADFSMRMFNADGSEAGMCGNASRCVGKFVHDKGLTSKTEISLETKSGIKYLQLFKDDPHGPVTSVRVDMGPAVLDAGQIPVIYNGLPSVINQPVTVDGHEYRITCVSMGNPHAVVFTKDIDDLKIEEIGPKFENHPVFPDRTNTEFIEIIDPKTLKMRVWERGSGETLACGTGACAAAVAGVLNGLSETKVTVKLRGGDLDIEWKQQENRVYLTGPAEFVFEGEIN